jgi:hypothetical protein
MNIFKTLYYFPFYFSFFSANKNNCLLGPGSDRRIVEELNKIVSGLYSMTGLSTCQITSLKTFPEGVGDGQITTIE